MPASPPAAPAAASGDLARLLATEARLDEALRHARDEAAALVATARSAAAARATALDAELAAAASRLASDVAEERRGREAELREGARQEAQAFDTVPKDRLDALARHVVARTIGGGAAP